ncbi:MAG: hypothetical protein WC058_06150 [Phycisphaeraceae bacterium]
MQRGNNLERIGHSGVSREQAGRIAITAIDRPRQHRPRRSLIT